MSSYCPECYQTDGFHREFCSSLAPKKIPINIPVVPEDAKLPQEVREGEPFQYYTVKDSGERQQFDSGMVRDVQTGKPDIARVFDGPMLYRWAEHITKGAVKYPDVRPGVPNWTLAAGEDELTRFKKSAARHFFQYMRGDTDEDHCAAVFFNLNGAEFVKAKLQKTGE